MSTRPWITSIAIFFSNPIMRTVALTIYYLLIILGLILLHGQGDFSTQSFVYQGF